MAFQRAAQPHISIGLFDDEAGRCRIEKTFWNGGGSYYTFPQAYLTPEGWGMSEGVYDYELRVLNDYASTTGPGDYLAAVSGFLASVSKEEADAWMESQEEEEPDVEEMWQGGQFLYESEDVLVPVVEERDSDPADTRCLTPSQILFRAGG